MTSCQRPGAKTWGESRFDALSELMSKSFPSLKRCATKMDVICNGLLFF